MVTSHLRISRVAHRTNLGVALCFALTPLAARGTRGLRAVRMFIAGCAFGEATGPSYLATIFGRTVITVTFPQSRSGVFFLPELLI